MACLVVPCVFSLSACGADDSSTHEHTFSQEWTKSTTEHWHECTSDGCDVVSEKNFHNYTDNNDTDCNTCGYIRSAVANNFEFITTSKTKTYNGEAVTFVRNTDFTISGDDEDIVVEYKIKNADDSAYTTTPFKDAGDYTARISFAGNAEFEAVNTNNTMDFSISKKTISANKKFSFEYNGTTSFSVASDEIPDAINGDDVQISFTSANKNAKTTQTTKVELIGQDKDNYALDTSGVSFEIVAKKITSFNDRDLTAIYNGETSHIVATTKDIPEILECDREMNYSISVVNTDINVGTKQNNSLEFNDIHDYNYELASTSVKSFEILPCEISVETASFTYNGDTTFYTNGTDNSIKDQIIANDRDNIKIKFISTDKNVGENKLKSISLEGTGSDNYKLTNTESLNLKITKKAINRNDPTTELTGYANTSKNVWQNTFELTHDIDLDIVEGDVIKFETLEATRTIGERYMIFPIPGNNTRNENRCTLIGNDYQNYEFEDSYYLYLTFKEAPQANIKLTYKESVNEYPIQTITFGDQTLTIKLADNTTAESNQKLFGLIYDNASRNDIITVPVYAQAGNLSAKIAEITRVGDENKYYFDGGTVTLTDEEKPAVFNLFKDVQGFTDSEGRWIYAGSDDVTFNIYPQQVHNFNFKKLDETSSFDSKEIQVGLNAFYCEAQDAGTYQFNFKNNDLSASDVRITIVDTEGNHIDVDSDLKFTLTNSGKIYISIISSKDSNVSISKAD